MVTRVLFITSNIEFAAQIKSALERTGLYQVRPFSLPDAAIEYLRENPHEVAVVDFTIPDIRVDLIVEGLRSAAPQIAIVATPRQHEEVVRLLRLQNSINVPFSARYIIPVLDKAVIDLKKNPPPLPQTRPVVKSLGSAPPPRFDDTPVMISDDPAAAWQADMPNMQDEEFQQLLTTIDPNAPNARPQSDDFADLVNSMRADQAPRESLTRQQQFVDFILRGGMNPLIEQIERARGTQPLEEIPTASALPRPIVARSSLFERLAQEEPPMPTLEESGTVRDLIDSVNETGFRDVLSILRGEEPSEAPPVLSSADFYNAVSSLDNVPGDSIPVTPPLLRQRADDVHVDYDFDQIPAAPDSLPELPDESSTPARLILQEILDGSKWLSGFSLEELIANIERQQSAYRPKIKPLPSWIKENALKKKKRSRDDNRFVREPEFLELVPPPDSLPEVPPGDMLSLSDQFTEQPTRMSSAQPYETSPGELETTWDAPPPPARIEDAITPFDMLDAPDTLPETVSEPFFEEEPFADAWEIMSPFVADDEDEWTQYEPSAAQTQEVEDLFGDLPRFTTEDFNTEFERLSAFEFAQRQNPDSVDPAETQDPYLAQLALSLTQVSLELTAEATLLTHDERADGALVAYAGRMQTEDIDELRSMIANDWNVNADEARIRFITLPNSGKDFMLYSRRTVDTLILSLVFSGITPLRDIRQQGKRLIDALESIPDGVAVEKPSPRAQLTAPPVMRAEPPPDVGTYAPYACVWLIRDANMSLDDDVAQAIIAGMITQLREQYWRIQDLQAQGDYIYLLAEIPGETPPYTIIRDLKRRSADIARKQNQDLPSALWADSYLVVTPGRALDEEEIQQFINFERMV